jgi:hypothetical protein
MKTSILLSLVILSFIAIPKAKSQWHDSDTNTIGNWKFIAANNGVVFNNDNIAGAYWPRGTSDRMIFGGGLWLGGKVITFIDRMTKAVSIGYNPNTGQSDFCPGSAIYDGTFIDSSASATEKYGMYSSVRTPNNEWPIRLVNSKPSYIDDVSLRASSGPPAFTGDEDIFIVYKNTDTSFFAPWHLGQPIPHFEIRTTLSSWRKGLGADVILVKNQIIYLDTNTLYDPVAALALDPDLPSQGNSNLELGFITDSVSGCMVYTHDVKTQPVLGVYLLKGFSTSHHIDPGITSLHRWTIVNDPPDRESQYDFMTDETKDTLSTGITADMRLLLASAHSEPLLKGDTINFDYALFIFQPAANNDTASLKKIIDVGARLKRFYEKDSLSLLDVRSQGLLKSETVDIYPNPSGAKCTVVANEPITSVRLFDVTGKEISLQLPERSYSTEITIPLNGIPAGIYFIELNHHLRTKLIVE